MKIQAIRLVIIALCALAITFGSANARETDPREVSAADLPREARQVLALIRSGGPFTHRQDGSVFGNREKLLPLRPRGYYVEYTVPTPGRRDRGARRVVAGGGGEFYYSNDHYNSFRRIRE